jgi:polyisoprenoid-binding protein YceI
MSEPKEALMSLTAITCDALTPPGTWHVDTARSRVRFSVNHIMVATVTGDFTDFEGTFEVTPTGVATAVGHIGAASIDTNEPKRDARLRSADFFDVERHPAIGFVSTAIECVEESRLRITGRLTIRGVTQDITLEGRVRAPSGSDRRTLELRGSLSHRAFGVGTDALAANRVILGHKVKILAELCVVKAEATREAA